MSLWQWAAVVNAGRHQGSRLSSTERDELFDWIGQPDAGAPPAMPMWRYELDAVAVGAVPLLQSKREEQ